MVTNELFILGNNGMLIQGVREVISNNFPGNEGFFKIRQTTLIELIQIDASYKMNKKYSIAIVPAHLYDTLHIFAGLEYIKMVPSNMSMLMLSTLLGEILLSDTGIKRKKSRESPHLTAKERRYCYLVYSGVSNKKIARYFQCTEKNVSYLKRKIMSKWHCKNSLDFYKTINYFYNDNEGIHRESGFA